MKKKAMLAHCLALLLLASLCRPAVAVDFRDAPEMVVIPAGSFIMGSPATEAGRAQNEGPQHRVTIAHAFAVGKYDVTRGVYAAFVAATRRPDPGKCFVFQGVGAKGAPKFGWVAGLSWKNPLYRQTDRDPAVCIDFADAEAYAAWLSKLTHQRYRLLSEAEFEYAARGGTPTPRWWGTAIGDVCLYANTADLAFKRANPNTGTVADCDDHYAYISPVGTYRPNPFGLYDMLGDAWQWTEDCYHPNYAGAPTDGSAWTTGDCRERVRRGGSWFRPPAYLRAAARSALPGNQWHGNAAFRVALDLGPP